MDIANIQLTLVQFAVFIVYNDLFIICVCSYI